MNRKHYLLDKYAYLEKQEKCFENLTNAEISEKEYKKLVRACLTKR